MDNNIYKNKNCMVKFLFLLIYIYLFFIMRYKCIGYICIIYYRSMRIGFFFLLVFLGWFLIFVGIDLGLWRSVVFVVGGFVYLDSIV